MYTVIAQTRTINIEASLLPLDITSTEKRSYQYNRILHFIVTNTSTIYSEVTFIHGLHYSCLLDEFSDITTIQVLALKIPTPKLPPNRMKDEPLYGNRYY